ncbi:NAD(P)/FAD-dependent oxidoreductase, partial [Longibacter sp.]|uniref:NAD(P)/FAD-dependent oxidoreductase n=1 Tax=Longibacter sp. TaxID=2045415 RepID=UPI003EB9B101
QDAAAAYPDIAEWLSADAFRERLPDVRTCGGGLFIPRGGAIDVPAFVNGVLDAARSHGAHLHTAADVRYWSERDGTVTVDVEHAAADGGGSLETYRGSHLLLCVGQGYSRIAELTNLQLTGIKGQTVRVRRPTITGSGPLHPMSGRGYIVPDDDILILGSSYQHNFDSLQPDPEETNYILTKTAEMLPGLEHAEVLDVTSGVRVKHLDSNLPIVGPLPDRERIWTFTALGSKGLLTAPIIAHELHGYLQNPAIIPNDLAVPRLLDP